MLSSQSHAHARTYTRVHARTHACTNTRTHTRRDITLRTVPGCDEQYRSELGTEMSELLHALTASHAH